MENNNNSRTARRKQAEAEQKSARNKKPKKKKSFVKRIFKAAVIAGLVVLVAGAGLFTYYASTAPELDESLLKDPLSSQILASNGKVIYETGIEKRNYIPYEKIPKELEAAILATEDVRFYKHHGIDFWRLGGAVLANFRSGFGSQGASTLTQQVIKNSFLKNEKTLKRKAQEAWLAFKLERNYSKEEIFEMYFNKVLMSGNKYGIGTGAKVFYGKDVSELDLPEMAMLAGMPQSPNAFNPFKHPERAEKRRNIVLRLMNQHGKITKKQMEEAQALPVTASLLPEEKREKPSDIKYQAYIDIVMNELQEKGYKDVEAEGVKIVTSLDTDAQLAVERALADPSNFESKTIQAGMTVVNTKTGEIVAVGGGRDYKLFNHNFASDQKRQPGSTIKPILDFGPAVEYMDWSTGQTVVDEKTNNIKANNVDGLYRGTMTMRQALYESRNIPAIKIFEEVGYKNAGKFAEGLGLPMDRLVQSDAIGGGSNDFSTLQMAGAFAAFGNEGIYIAPHAVKKIILRDGKTEINLKPDPVSAMKDSTAYMVTDMLRDVLTKPRATGKLANIPGIDLAGKTGTTNYSAEFKQKNNIGRDSVPDSWFAGYSTDYTIAVWGGHEKRTDPIIGYNGGRNMPKSLFRQVMGELVSKETPNKFKKPNSVEEATIAIGTNPLQLASPSTPSNLKSKELFVRGTAPKQTFVPEEPEELELEAPTGLTAEYKSDNKEIDLSWDHKKPDSDSFDEDVQFAVSVAIDGGGAQNLTTTTNDSFTFGGVEPGHTYTFSVVAKAGDVSSSPASTTIMIQATEEPAPEEDEDNKEEEPPGNPDNNGETTPPENEEDGNNNSGNDGNNNGGNGNNNENDTDTGTGNNNNGNGNSQNGGQNNGQNSGNNSSGTNTEGRSSNGSSGT